MLIKRSVYLSNIIRLFVSHPIVALLGPRQSGKTTLAREYYKSLGSKEAITHLDLEDPTDLARLNDPKLALQDLNGLVVIDEIQRAPEIFPVLRVLVDRPDRKTRFLILGSASRDLIRQSSETLAGRIAYQTILPFSKLEVPSELQGRLWIQGGFPKSLLAPSQSASVDWRKNYISTFLERDIPNLGISIPAETLRRFWMMLVHYHGQVVNYSELGRSFGISDTTVKRYIEILVGTFMIRLLYPWHENISKRQVKAPKLYFVDSGLYHYFLGVNSERELLTHPKIGSSWEGYALEQVIRSREASVDETFFWATQSRAELDLLILKNNKKRAYEIKYTSAPSITPSMRNAIADLKLDQLTIVIPGSQAFPLSEKIKVCGLDTLD